MLFSKLLLGSMMNEANTETLFRQDLGDKNRIGEGLEGYTVKGLERAVAKVCFIGWGLLCRG